MRPLSKLSWQTGSPGSNGGQLSLAREGVSRDSPLVPGGRNVLKAAKATSEHSRCKAHKFKLTLTKAYTNVSRLRAPRTSNWGANRVSQTQAVLRALAEPRRVAILKLVGSRELRAGEISRQFRTTRPAISQHLRVLTKAGLLGERRQGTRRFYRIRREGFAELRSFLDSFWTERLGVLKEEAEKEARGRRGR